MDSSSHSTPAPEELLEHVAFVRQLARGLVYGEDRVDEVVQQSFLRAIKSPPRHRGNLRSWFAVVVRNVVYRDADRTRVREDAQWAATRDTDAAEASDQAAERADFQRSLSEAVHELPEPFRTVVVLRYFDELSIDEIAERLGVPRETVRSRQRRGLARLRDRLGKEDRESGSDWRLSAFAVLGESVPFSEGAATTSVAWWLPFAIGLPLVALGGAWWWTTGTAGSNDAAKEPAARTALVTGAADESVASASSSGNREALVTRDAALPVAHVRARITSRDDDTPIVGAQLVMGERTDEAWAFAELTADESGVCYGPLTPLEDLPTGLRLAEHVRSNSLRSFAVARAPGYAPLRLLPAPKGSVANDVRDFGELRLERGVPVRGRVIDFATGGAIRGAQLWLSDDGGSTGSADRAVPVGQTRSDGSFELEELVASNRFAPFSWTLFAEHAGRCGWIKLPLDALATAVDVQIEVGPFAALDLTLKDEAGEPLERALVRAVIFHAPWSTRQRAGVPAPGLGGPLHRQFERRTDARGRVSFDALPARDDTLAALSGGADSTVHHGGPYELWIDVPGREPRFAETFSLPIGERSERTILLSDLTAVRRPGRVLSAYDGRPLRDAFVRSPELGMHAAVDEQGNFVLPDRFPRRIEVGAPGHLSQTYDWSETGEVARICELERAATLRGHVRDASGVRLANLLVRAEGGSQGGDWKTVERARELETRTDERGRFHFDGLSAGEWQVRVEIPPGTEYGTPPVRVVNAGTDDLEFVLQRITGPARDVRVRVIDAGTGTALRALDAELVWIGTQAPPPPVVRVGREYVELDGVRMGDWRLWVRVSGRGAALLDISVEPGDGVLDLQLPCSGLCRIEGRVELPAAAGVPRKWIVASVFQGPAPPSRWPGLRTEYGSRAMRSAVAEDGSFAMETVVAGPYRLELIAQDWTASARVDVEPGTTLRATLRAERAGELLLRGALPLPDGLSLWLSDGVGGEAWHWLRPEIVGAGWEVRRALPSGEQSWALAVRTPAGSPKPLPPGPELASGSLVVESGVTHVVEVTLPD